MISVREAQQKIISAVPAFPPLALGLEEALGRFVAEKILSPIDSPPFRNSAMDGYALRADDTLVASEARPHALRVVATVSAGIALKREIRPGESVRIFTGAMIPENLDAVVKQEDVVRKGEEIVLTSPVKKGENIRLQGEEIRAGQVVASPGCALTPAAIAQLANLGIQKVSVHRPPRVGILVTGSEIISAGTSLEPGQIYDSNSFALRLALQELALTASFISHSRDQIEDLRRAIAAGMENSDFLIVTGGVSVGDFDYVRDVAGALGIQEVFWKVKQKPGKPIFFGKKGGSKFLFGLPGNPASALVCFYEYVRVGMLRAMGSSQPFLPRLHLPLVEGFRKKPGPVHFLRACLETAGNSASVRIFEQQGSHILKSFAQANCLVVMPEETERVEAGGLVEVHLLPGIFLNPGGGMS